MERTSTSGSNPIDSTLYCILEHYTPSVNFPLSLPFVRHLLDLMEREVCRLQVVDGQAVGA